VEYFDTEQKKLRLRVSSIGVKSFAVVKKVNGSPKRVTKGDGPFHQLNLVIGLFVSNSLNKGRSGNYATGYPERLYEMLRGLFSLSERLLKLEYL
jgi:hypothetical protein